MDNGYVILSIIGLLFLSMYGYAYASVAMEKLREKRAIKAEMEQEELRLEKMAMNKKAREEKLNQLNKRSEEIKRELENLEGFKKEIEVKKLKIS